MPMVPLHSYRKISEMFLPLMDYPFISLANTVVYCQLHTTMYITIYARHNSLHDLRQEKVMTRPLARITSCRT
jgi:hypothetical protein